MSRALLAGASILVLAPWLFALGGDEKLRSGPQVGEIIPGPFDSFNLSGAKGTGRQHCLVCEYGLDPVVAIFARETKGKDAAALQHLLANLDGILPKHADAYLRAFVVHLSPHAIHSAIKPRDEDTKKVVEQTKKDYAAALAQAEKAAKIRAAAVEALNSAKKLEKDAGGKATDDSKKERQRAKELEDEAGKEEAIARKQLAAVAETLGAEAAVPIAENEKRVELLKDLSKQAAELKNVVVACMPAEGPKAYKIDPKAEITIFVYQRHKVLANHAYSAAKFTEGDADQIVEYVDRLMKEQRKKK